MLQPCNVPVMDVKALYTYTFELNCVVFFFFFLLRVCYPTVSSSKYIDHIFIVSS